MTPPESFAHSDAVAFPLEAALVPPGPRPTQAAAPSEEAATYPVRHSPTLTWLLDGGGWPWLRVGADLTALLGALVAAASVGSADVPRLLPLVPLAIILFWVGGMYRRRISASLVRMMMTVTSSLATSTIALAIWHSYVDRHPIPESVLVRIWTLAFLSVASGRAALLGVRYLARTLGAVATPTLIIGAGKVGIQIADRLSSRTGYGLSPIGFLDNPDAAEQTVRRTTDLPLLGSPEELERIVRRTGARHIVISFARGRDHELVPLIRRCNEMRLDISLVPRLFESVNHRLARDSVGPLPLHVIQPTNPRSWEFTCKHIIDRTVAAALLVGLMPLLAAAAAVVKLTSPGPVLFRQWRVGRDGRVFEMLKFRSMRVGEQLPWAGPGLGLAPGGVEGEDRRTPVGRFLRRTSVDELPQLWNVLRGEMSLVGPRPERPEYVEQFRGEVKRYDDRHRVKSGITGAAQVNGLRGKTGLEDRIDWDNYYIENWTLALDLKILAHTLITVLRGVE
jgi:exopolysaccharide biosynthesis polyprenyl glycosylphosphotransferase